MPLFNVVSYGADPTGGADSSAAFAAADAAASAANPPGTVGIPEGMYKISANRLLQADLHFFPGAVVAPEAGITLTVDGRVTADDLRIFAGAGMITRSAGSTSYVVSGQWFGVKSNRATNDVVALQKAIDFCTRWDPALPLRAKGAGAVIPAGQPLHIGRPFNSTTSFFDIEADFYAAEGNVLFFASSLSSSEQSERVRFTRCTFRSAAPTNVCYVIELDRFVRVRYESCEWYRMGVGETTGYVQSHHFLAPTIYGMTETFLKATGGAYDVRFFDPIMETGTTFVHLTSNTAHPVAGCGIWGGCIQRLYSSAIVADTLRGFTVSGVYFEDVGMGNADRGIPRGNPDIDFTHGQANLGVAVTAGFHSVDPKTRGTANYAAIKWGATDGTAAGNALFSDKPDALHALTSASHVVILDGAYPTLGVPIERLRIIRGAVSASGVVMAGKGFTVLKTGLGEYTITPSVPFPAAPASVVTPEDTSGTACSAFTSPFPGYVAVAFRNSSHARVDSAFNFEIVGPF